MISNDRILLGSSAKSIQNALFEGGSVYKSCLAFSKLVEDIEKKIKENEELTDLSKPFDP